MHKSNLHKAYPLVVTSVWKDSFIHILELSTWSSLNETWFRASISIYEVFFLYKNIPTPKLLKNCWLFNKTVVLVELVKTNRLKLNGTLIQCPSHSVWSPL
jgi:hypothetical protein